MYADLREWLQQVEAFGELKMINGAHWDKEMGPLTQIMHEKYKTRTPALLFDDIPDYPKGFRTLYGHFSTPNRVALTLGLPIGMSRIEMVRAYQEKIKHLKPIPPQYVDDGPVMENIQTGDDVKILGFPSPRHHERDNARYIGTACAAITKDPDRDWYNLGTYRSTVYDDKTVGLQITGGKHGRIHRDKYFSKGEAMKVAILVGQDPLHTWGLQHRRWIDLQPTDGIWLAPRNTSSCANSNSTAKAIPPSTSTISAACSKSPPIPSTAI